MAFVHADSVSVQESTSVTTSSTTLSLAVNAGDLLVAVLGFPAPLSEADLSDTLGNVWHIAGVGTNSALVYCPSSLACAAGALTFTQASALSGRRFTALDRFTGGPGVLVNFAFHDLPSGTYTSGDCGTIGDAAAGQLLYGGQKEAGTAVTWTAGSSNGASATIGSQASNTGGAGFSEYITATIAGAQTMTWTCTSFSQSTSGVSALFDHLLVLPKPFDSVGKPGPRVSHRESGAQGGY